MAKSVRERQAIFREKHKIMGRSELRSVMATKAEQTILKQKIKEWLIEMRKQENRT